MTMARSISCGVPGVGLAFLLVSYDASHLFPRGCPEAAPRAYGGGCHGLRFTTHRLSRKTQRHHSSRPRRQEITNKIVRVLEPIDRRTRSGGLTASSYLRRHSASDSTPPSDVALGRAPTFRAARPRPRTGTRPRGWIRTRSFAFGDGVVRVRSEPGYRTRCSSPGRSAPLRRAVPWRSGE